MKHSLLWVALVLVVIWIVARVVLAVTSFALHLIWIAAVILFLAWLARQFKKQT